MKTLLETLQAGAGYLEARGVEDARRNIELPAAKVMGCTRLELYLQFDRPMAEGDLAPLRELLRRRGAREPLQHLLGGVEFAGRHFRSDARGLIPRPETEELASLLLHRFRSAPPARVVDVGCGSGVLGLTLAAEWPGAEVTMVDRSADALALARENAEALDLLDRSSLTITEGDLLADLQGPFDLVVANLPYIDPAELAALQPEVKFDPQAALDGGERGVELILRLIGQLPQRLAGGGEVALEIGEGQAGELSAALSDVGLARVEVVADLSGIDRFLLAGG